MVPDERGKGYGLKHMHLDVGAVSAHVKGFMFVFRIFALLSRRDLE